MLDHIEQRIVELIDQRAEEIKAFGMDIYTHAETGFKEFRTAQKLTEGLESLGLQPETGIAVTGVKAYLKDPNSTEGLNICLMGEMDALPMPLHPDAWEETGAAHACGHCCQMTGVYGAAMALVDPEVKAAINGNVTFIGVPSEEFSSDTEYKLGLIKEGKIGCCGGKSEMIRLGALNDIDITVAHHTWNVDYAIVLNDSGNGFVNKSVRFIGKAAHGTQAPKGIDAFEAAQLAISAINANRETFDDKDCVRVHGIMTKGGDASNIIADNITMDYSVRAKTMPAIRQASYKVDRCLKAGAMAVGAGVEIETIAGYLPYVPSKNVNMLKSVLDDLSNGRKVDVIDSATDPMIHSAGSTDLGELSCMMPIVQFGTNGFSGDGHTVTYRCIDQDLAYVETAKIYAICAYRLLKDNAKAANELLDGFKPLISQESFCQYLEEMQSVERVEMTPVPSFEEKK